MTVIVWQTIAS